MTDKKTDVWKPEMTQRLAEAFVFISDVTIMQDFMRDILSEKEIIEMSARFEAAAMLQAGTKYLEITKATKLSSRTIARINDWLQNGCNGYQAALDIVNAHHKHLSPARA